MEFPLICSLELLYVCVVLYCLVYLRPFSLLKANRLLKDYFTPDTKTCVELKHQVQCTYLIMHNGHERSVTPQSGHSAVIFQVIKTPEIHLSYVSVLL